MTITDRTSYHISMIVGNNEPISTEIPPTGRFDGVGTEGGGYPPSKFVVTYFEDDTGQLEVSNDGETWIQVEATELTVIEPFLTLSKYVRITNATSVEPKIHFSYHK